MTINVIHIGSSYRPYHCGAALRIANIIDNIPKDNGINIHLITNVPDVNGVYGDDIGQNLIIYRRHGLLQMLCALKRICHKERINLIHAHNARVALCSILFCPTIPTIIELHSLHPIAWCKGVLLRYVLRKCKSIIVLGAGARQYLIQQYSIASEKIFTLVNGINQQKFYRKTEELRETSVVGYIGAFHDWQGVFDLLLAAPLVANDWTDARFVLIGDGPDWDRAQRMAEKLRIRQLVDMPGKISPDEIATCLSRMNIFVLPRPSTTATETTIPLKIFEAMSAGVPIVASNVGGLTEVLTDRVDALLYQAGNVRDLADKILILLKDKQLRYDLSQRALNNPYLRRSWQKVANELLMIYKRTLTNSNDNT